MSLTEIDVPHYSLSKIYKFCASTPEILRGITDLDCWMQGKGLRKTMIPQNILKHLVRKVDALAPITVFRGTEETVNEVIFESDIDGMRYYLVRSRPRSKHGVKLSPRERAIAKLVAQGLDNKSIAKSLSISPWTVATYLRRIFSKLGVTSRAAMIARILEENMLLG